MAKVSEQVNRKFLQEHDFTTFNHLHQPCPFKILTAKIWIFYLFVISHFQFCYSTW